MHSVQVMDTPSKVKGEFAKALKNADNAPVSKALKPHVDKLVDEAVKTFPATGKVYLNVSGSPDDNRLIVHIEHQDRP